MACKQKLISHILKTTSLMSDVSLGKFGESPLAGYRQGTSCILPGWGAEGGSKFSVTLCCGSSLIAQSCPTLCDPMDCSPPGSSVHGISQARILKWVAIFYSGGSPPTTQVSTQNFLHWLWVLYHWALREAPLWLFQGRESHPEDPTLMTSSNPNYLPKAPDLLILCR